MTKHNVPDRQKERRRPEDVPETRENEGLPLNENLKKLPVEVYGDTKIRAKQRK